MGPTGKQAGSRLSSLSLLRAEMEREQTSAETILTLQNRESIHFAKFVHDTCADTFFEESIHFMSQFLERFGTFRSAKVVKFVL